jgi:rhodanese-related sulfurtransferase
MSIRTISAPEAFASRNGGSSQSIDVRTPAEFTTVHAEGATLVPLDRFDPNIVKQNVGADSVYLICGSGTRARQAAEKCQAAGIQDIAIVEGGTPAWESAGLPVVHGRKTISLERQVRILAGSLVVLGILLGWFVHRDFFALSAFIGAGLVFAGVTDTCGMGLLLAKAPWNQAAAQPKSPNPPSPG